MRGVTKPDIPLAMHPVKIGLSQLSLESISLHCSGSSRLLGANYWLQYTGATETFPAWVELASDCVLCCTSDAFRKDLEQTDVMYSVGHKHS